MALILNSVYLISSNIMNLEYLFCS